MSTHQTCRECLAADKRLPLPHGGRLPSTIEDPAVLDALKPILRA
jgi:hypothetical protein